MKEKKIIYIGAFRLPNHDAAAVRVLNNAKAMRECGYEVTFISWGGKYRDTDLCSDGKYRVDGFEYIISNEIDSSGYFMQRLMAKYCRGEISLQILLSLEQKPDLIILYNAGYGWTKKMMKFCAQYNIKLANDITEWYAINELHLPDLLPNYINMTRTQRRVKNKIVISSYLDEFYSESNNLLLPPLCDPAESKWNLTVDDERIKPFEGITLIYAGNPARKDCLHTIIQAVNELANEGAKIRFMILGTDRDSYSRQYGNLFRTKDLHENILFLGRVSQDLIPAYYKEADFMVLIREPSRKNMAGFPTKFAEAITAGVPVIANTTSDLGKFIVNGKSGFVVEGYSYEDLLITLRNHVIPLSRKSIDNMKQFTAANNILFDYRYYSHKIESFLNNLQ
jgi:glycosyltransferase involved in cell wall biosynthesis